MRRDPMAGAWIVEGVIAALVVLLIGGAVGLSLSGWCSAVAIAAGCGFGALARRRGRPRDLSD